MYRFITITATAVLLLCGCSKTAGSANSDKPGSIELTAGTQENYNLSSDATKITLSFNASDKWSASVIKQSGDNWFSFSPERGQAGSNSINLTMTENATDYERSVTLELSCGSATRQINILQKEKDALMLTTSKIEIGADGGEALIKVRSNLIYTVSVPQEYDWIRVISSKNVTESTVTLSISENRSKTPRNGKVAIIAQGMKPDTAYIYQSGLTPSIILGDKTVQIPAEGKIFNVEVSSNVDVEMVMPTDKWIHNQTTKSVSTSTFSLSVEANEYYEERQAIISFVNRNEGISESLTVKQLPKKVDQRTKTFDESTIVLSLGAVSDVHVEGGSVTDPSNKFRNALLQLGSQSAKHDHSGLDGLMVAGDLIQHGYNGTYNQIDEFKRIYESVYDPTQTPLVYTIGNHDPKGWWTSSTISEAKEFSRRFGEDYFRNDVDMESTQNLECRDCVIHGYHILAITPVSLTPVTYTESAIKWLDAKLKSLTEAEPDKYIMLITHPMIQNTVYGSTLVSAGVLKTDATPSYWYTRDLTPVLEKYPQVVTFGGHLHFPLNHPGSIWQGAFTSLGCGSTRYMAFEGGDNYINKASGTTLNDNAEFSQGMLVQMDASGNIRFTRMDFYHNTTIGEPWEISYPDASGKTHLSKYSPENIKAINKAPVIAEISVEQGLTTSSSVPCTVKWSAADDDQFARHYQVVFSRPNGSKTEVWIMSDYYRHGNKADMTPTYSYNLGALPVGKYSVEVTAVDPWGATGLAKTEFEVTGPTADPDKLPDAYIDINFKKGSITDTKGKVSITNHGASIEEVQVTHAGSTHRINALRTGNGSYTMCQIDEFKTSADFQTFAKNGFTVEAFAADHKGSSGVQGIMCGTDYGGWGLALRNTGIPYFIVGEDKQSTYKNADGSTAVTKSELVHLLGVYDTATKKLSLYINGTLVKSTSITGSFFCGTTDTFNRFCLGGDIKGGDIEPEFPSTDMTIVQARMYSIALNAKQAGLAYEAAVNNLK